MLYSLVGWDNPTAQGVQEAPVQTQMPPLKIPGSEQAGFLTVDEKGRVALPKAIREALDIAPGSSLAFAVLDGMLVLISQDKHLALLMERVTEVLTEAELTTQNTEDELLQIRGEVFREIYGDAFVDELERKYGHLVGTALNNQPADVDDER
jgi:AbrB family looped-hinge helix DNA binding protein